MNDSQDSHYNVESYYETIKELQTWQIISDQKSMSFFRCQSHQYPFIQTFVSQNLKKKQVDGLTIQLYGSNSM